MSSDDGKLDANTPSAEVPEPTLPVLARTQDLLDADAVDGVYRAKMHVINDAMQEIGMGRYQWSLFAVAGFGYFADSVWPLLAGLILSPVVNEFGFNAPFLSLALNAGLLVGAVTWGVGSDIWGRRFSFNATLLITGAFGIAAGGAPSFAGLAALFALSGFGVGGNMPVDSAVFLEFIPGSHQFLLTFLAVWWCIGQLIASLIAWPLIARFSCAEDVQPCPRTENMGWRYLIFTIGALTLVLWVIRFFLFPLYESPRFLLGRGRDAEAVAAVRAIAVYNGRDVSLAEEDLAAAARAAGGEDRVAGVLAKDSRYSLEHVRALFGTKKMALSTSLLIAIWGIIGLASTLYNSFLPYLLARRGAHFGDSSYNTTYRNNFIIATLGVPGAFLSAWTVELPLLGRRGTLALSSALVAVFLFGSTTARSSNALLGWNCGYAFFSNIMYGVLYALSPEIFPAKDRGTGNALTATATRVFGVIAPVIALYADLASEVPVYISGALILLAAGLALLVPFEPRGKASL